MCYYKTFDFLEGATNQAMLLTKICYCSQLYGIHFSQFEYIKEDRIDLNTCNRGLKIAELNMIAKNAKKIGWKM